MLIKVYSKEENPVVLSGYQFMVGGIIMIFIGLLMGGNLNISVTASCQLRNIYCKQIAIKKSKIITIL